MPIVVEPDPGVGTLATAEEAVKERAQLAAIIESSDDGIISKDLNGVVLTWNTAAERIYGYSAEEMIGKSIRQLIPPERQHEEDETLASIRQGKPVRNYETERVRKDGVRILVNTTVSPIFAPDGSVLAVSHVVRDVSDARRLRAEISRLAAIVDSSDDGIISKTLDGTILTWNPAAQRIYGYSAEEMVGHSIRRLYPPQLEHEEDITLAEIRAGRPVRNYETERIRKDGTRILVNTTVSPIFAPDGTVLAVSHIVRDVTEIKAADRELKKRIDQLKLLTESLPVMIAYVDRDERMQILNRHYEAIFGRSRDEVIGKRITEVAPPERKQMFREKIDAVFRGETVSFELQLPVKDGEIRDFVATYVPERDESGEVQGFFTLVHDLTEERRSARNARFTADVTTMLTTHVDSRSLLQMVAQAAVPYFADWCAVDLVDEVGLLQRLAISHIDPEKVTLAREWAQRWPPDPSRDEGGYRVLRSGKAEFVQEVTREMLEASIEDPELLELIESLTIRSYMAVPLRIGGRVAGVITFIIAESNRSYREEDLELALDLAQRTGTAIENSQLYEALREADRKKDEFIATLAHELRNPLAPLLLGVEIISASETSNPQSKQISEMMNRQLSQLVRLVDDLLDVSRITTGKLQLQTEPLTVKKIIDNVLEMSQAVLAQRKHHLSTDIGSPGTMVYGDLTRITQIVMNLINNAAKYSEEGSPIELRTTADEGELVIRVRDYGIGIEPNHIDRLFDMFSQEESARSRSQGGLGIGLALARMLTQLHGGRIAACSEGLGHGSVFEVRLPIYQLALDTGRDTSADHEFRRRKILVIDDFEDIASSTVQILSMLNQDASMALNGPSGIERFQELRPELVLVDIGMPGMSGHEVAQRIRTLPGGQEVRLIALTGWGAAEDRDRSRRSGFNEHLVKPVNRKELERLLRD